MGSESTDASGNQPGLAVTVPNLTGGTYQVFATDNTNTASANFTIPFNLLLAAGFFDHRSAALGDDDSAC